MWETTELRNIKNSRGLRGSPCLTCTSSLHGTSFRGAFAERLRERGIEVQTSPVAHPKSNGIIENRHDRLRRKVSKLIYEERAMHGDWPQYLTRAVSALNHTPSAHPPHETPYGRLFKEHNVLPIVQNYLRPPRADVKKKFVEGEIVVFQHPTIKYNKLDYRWRPYRIVDIMPKSTLVVNLKPLEAQDMFHPDYSIKAHVGAIGKASPDIIEKFLTTAEAAALADKPEQPTDTRVPIDYKVGRFIIFQPKGSKHMYVGKVWDQYPSSRQLRVHYYGCQTKVDIAKRQLKGCHVDDKGKQTFSHVQVMGSKPDIYDVHLDDIITPTPGFYLTAKGHIPPDIVDEFIKEKTKRKAGTLRFNNTDPVPSAKEEPPLLDTSHCRFEGFEFIPLSLSERQDVLSFMAETTHQTIKYPTLPPEQRKGVDAARQKEFDKMLKYDTYVPVHKSKVPNNAEIVSSMLVDTLKLQPNGERIYKSRLVARGDQDVREGLDTSTSTCPPESVRLALLTALASINLGGDTITTVDVENAYLQAQMTTSGTTEVYVVPPKCHPDFK